MITQTIQVTVDLDTIAVPYTYSFSSSSTCVSFSNQSGSSSATTVTTTVSFTDENCIADNPINVLLIGADGCPKSQQVQITNPCTNLTLSINQIEDYKFQAITTAPSCAEVDIEWSFNDNIFNIRNQQDSSFLSTIELDFNVGTTRGRIPVSSSISATIVDCNGCELTTTKVFDICKPEVEDFVKHLQCYSNTLLGFTHRTGVFTIPDPSNCTGDINWGTLKWDLPAGFSVLTAVNSGPSRGSTSGITHTIVSDSTVDPGTYTGTYTVSDEYGVVSNQGVVTFVVRACEENNTITIPDKRINVDCNTVSPGDTITINVEEELIVQTGAVVDWSTWTLVDPPTPSSPSIVLTTNADGDHVIEYETDSPTILNDVFAWTVCDTNGNCAQASVYTIVECITGPTAVADADCVACNSSVTIDVLANDTSSGPLDVNSVQIETNPTYGTVDVNADGTITYTPNSGYEGSDTFAYSVADTLGERSNSANVVMTVICAGNNTNVTICNS